MSQAQTSGVPEPSNYLNKDIQYFELLPYVLQAIKNRQDRGQFGRELFTRAYPDGD